MGIEETHMPLHGARQVGLLVWIFFRAGSRPYNQPEAAYVRS